jgi:hypothetical protein
MEFFSENYPNIILGFIYAFWSILFLQSGLDKVFDFKGNLAWLTGHFEKSIFKGKVSLALAFITIFEVFAGVLSAIGLFQVIFSGESGLGVVGVFLSFASLLMLFFGQRMAKDYAGASSLVPYFVFALLSLLYIFHFYSM